MDPNKSLDESKIIAALLHDVHTLYGSVFNTRSLRNTTNVALRRLRSEGMGFLTKTLPRLGKCLDKALAEVTPLNKATHGFSTADGSELPRFLGEFFSRILKPDGTPLASPCTDSIREVRLILYSFYKYELSYTDEQEQQVVDRFKETEVDLSNRSTAFEDLRGAVERSYTDRRSTSKVSLTQVSVAREAKILLSRLFATFDPKAIHPRHGPGAVATKQKLWEKYQWSNVSSRITALYPLDAYYYASLGHVCDDIEGLRTLGDADLPARVILVPKDSRGPRLISCEPVDFQWIQQGLGRALVRLVESNPITKWNVFFTDQTPNQCGALLGSTHGKYATLDLNEASDRVSSDLVRLLFPEHIYMYLEACRTQSTVLPSGEVIRLNKFAPMGSCLCFPILALTVWAILTASAPDADTREGILVYGDDVIVPTANAANAIEQLESFGLKVNRDKSCTSGFFRESCGTDAFKGINVTPVRFRTVWSSTPSAGVYSSWIAYANSLYDRRYYSTYDLIVGALVDIYGPIPDESMHVACPRLREVPDHARPATRRWNKCLQKHEFRVRDVVSPIVTKEINGWSMLLRYFSEAGTDSPWSTSSSRDEVHFPLEESAPFTVRSYTKRSTSKLVKRWR